MTATTTAATMTEARAMAAAKDVKTSFVRPLPRLAAETMKAAAIAGGPAGPPPWLHARRQARATARNDDDNEDDRIGTEGHRDDDDGR